MPTPAELRSTGAASLPLNVRPAGGGMAAASDETTPLLGAAPAPPAGGTDDNNTSRTTSTRQWVYDFLNRKTSAGKLYEKFMIVLILGNVLAFVLSTCFVEKYVGAERAARCGPTCDWLWFGNHSTTSLLEVITIMVFTADYTANLWTADLDNIQYSGVMGRLRYVVSFFSLVDLASTVPFYVDLLTPNRDLVSSSWVRMLRLLRMMSVEGRYDTALTLVDDVYVRQKGVLGTALFVGLTVWMSVASLYYLVERRNLDMVYCPTCGDVDTSLCTIDEWGFANCTAAGCGPEGSNNNNDPYPCYNLYESIVMASYYALLNLFGEFPLVQQHSVGGQIVGTLTAVVAVAVFALPAGIIGNGFESVIAEKSAATAAAMEDATEQVGQVVSDALAPTTDDKTSSVTAATKDATTSILRVDQPRPSLRLQRLYEFWHLQSTPLAAYVDHGTHLCTLGILITFCLQTGTTNVSHWNLVFAGAVDAFNLLATAVFAMDYIMKVVSSAVAPTTVYKSRLDYATRFMPLLDLVTFVPFFGSVATQGTSAMFPLAYRVVHHKKGAAAMDETNWIAALRLVRILRWEKYTAAFGTFDAVLKSNLDVLTITAATAALLWVLFGSFLYFTERNNPDAEMASNYSTIPNAMWITLLNLSGESPLCQYSALGKIATGIMGLFATAVFGIPIGVLGASFEQVVSDLNDDTAQLEASAREALEEAAASAPRSLGTSLEKKAYEFVNGLAGPVSKAFEILIYFLIFLVVGVGIWQTVHGHENDWHRVEGFAVAIFTVEYLMRFIGAGADPEFSRAGSYGNAIFCRLRYVASFYSVVDLLAIVPFYLAVALPNSIVDRYDEYLRMFRILRLVKLDKYVPSITLLDNVIRLKFNSLRVAFFAAMTLWVLFAAFMYLCEYKDRENDLDDPVPTYGCDADCTMRDRFQNYFDSLYYTGIHLTGDYPITTYTWSARLVCLFMVLAAVGVVSIPSGLIASGFVAIVQSRNKALRGEVPKGRAGDDWYEIQYRNLQGVPPPPSVFGPRVDAWQSAVNQFLNGKETAHGRTEWTPWSYASRVFIFAVIIANIIAVLAESVPSIDFAVGNEKGNFFDVFEACSVMVFALEYILRLFCAPKNREALYSSWIYATTFFGIVDFLSTAPWFVQQALIYTGNLDENGDNAKIFRIIRMFRILQLEDFVVAFSKLDNVFRASKDVLKATGLMAIIIWVGCGALFYIFESNNPNWRSCDDSVPARGTLDAPGCFDFKTTAECNDFYPGLCNQVSFTSMPNALFYTAVFLGGEWGVVDFTWPGRAVCLFLCVVGIALYAIPIGTLFDSFGAVLGLVEDEDEEGEKEEPQGAGIEQEPLLKK